MATDLDLAVTISANAEGLSSGMAEAQTAVEGGAASITEAAEAMKEGITESTGGIAAAFKRMAVAAQEGALKSTEAMAEMGVQAKEHAESVESALGGVSKMMKLMGEVMVAGMIGEAFIQLAEKTGEFGESIEHASAKTGMGVEAIQQLRFAATMSGISADGLVAAMGRLSLKMAEASDKATPTSAAFTAVGLSAKELEGMKPDEVLNRVADAFSRSSDGAAKDAIAITLFGRAGLEMIPMLNKGSAGIEELTGKATKLGVVLSDEAIAKAAELGEQMKELSAVHESMTVQIGVALTPAFLSIANAFETNLKEGGSFQSFINGLGEVLKIVASAASMAAELFQKLGITIAGVAAQMEVLATQGLDAANKLDQGMQQDLDALTVSYNKFREDLQKPIEIPKPDLEGIDFGKEDLKFKVASKEKEESMMHSFESQLAIAKEGYQKQQIAAGSFVEWSKAQDAAFWQSKIGTAGLSAADLLSINIKLSADQIAIMKENFTAQLAGLAAQEAAQGKNSRAKIAIVQQEADMIAKAYGKESAQAIDALKKVAQMQQEAAADARTIAADQEKVASAQSEFEVQKAKEAFEFKKSQGLLTNAEILGQEQKFENDAFAIKVQALAKQAALIDPSHDPVKYQAVLTQIESLEIAHESKMSALQAANALQMKTVYTTAYASIETGMAASITSMVEGTKTFRQAAMSMLSSVLGSIINFYAQEVATEAVKQAKVMFGFGQQAAGSAATSTEQIANNAEVSASSIAAAKAAGAAWVGVAGAAGIASFAGAPWPVDIGAPAFGAAMALEAGAFASAEGGFDIPAGVNPMTQLHEKEMVLPAAQADAVRDMANGKKSGGDTHLHVHAMDAQSVSRLFENNGKVLMETLRKQKRNFA